MTSHNCDGLGKTTASEHGESQHIGWSVILRTKLINYLIKTINSFKIKVKIKQFIIKMFNKRGH